MRNLDRTYRPQRFVDVLGQKKSTDALRDQIASPEPRPVLITGPLGTGKTTLGLLYAKALFCERPQNGDPCGLCACCNSFEARAKEAFPDFSDFGCGEHSTVEDIRDLLDDARRSPYIAKRRVLLLDEAHNLSYRAQDALLKIIERPPKWTCFILLTNKPERLQTTLISRFTHLELRPLSAHDAVALLRGICEAESVICENSGLLLIHDAARGLPRPMLRILEKVGQQGPISESNVRLTLDLDIFGILSKFSAALLEGESQEQIRIIDDWTGLASRKLELIHEFFVHIYLSQVQGVDRENPVMQGFPADIQEKISRGIAERARRLNLDPDVFWQDIIAKLEPREGINDSQLAMIVSGLDRLLRQPALLGSTKVEVKSASRRLRISKSTSAMTTAQYLSGRQLRSLWQAGSFLPQNYGMLFNLRLTIRHAGVGIAGHRAGTSLISRLTHQLGMRLEEWSANDPAQYHWIYQHESDCDRHLITRVILAVYLCCYKPTEIHLSRGPAFRSPRSARSEVSSVLFPVLGLNIDF